MNFAKLMRAALAALVNLASQVSNLTQANASLSAENSRLQSENGSLRSQVLVDGGGSSAPTISPDDAQAATVLSNWMIGNGYATDVDPITTQGTPDGGGVSESQGSGTPPPPVSVEIQEGHDANGQAEPTGPF